MQQSARASTIHRMNRTVLVFTMSLPPDQEDYQEDDDDDYQHPETDVHYATRKAMASAVTAPGRSHGIDAVIAPAATNVARRARMNAARKNNLDRLGLEYTHSLKYQDFSSECTRGSRMTTRGFFTTGT
jgi:hypothetical protein